METYTIAQVIYGYQIPDNIPEHIQDVLKTYFDQETPGFLGFYWGFSYFSNKVNKSPIAFGITLDSFDEKQTVNVNSLVLEADEDVKNQFQTLFSQLTPDIQQFFKMSELQVFIVWIKSPLDMKKIIKEMSELAYYYGYEDTEWDNTGSSEAGEARVYYKTCLEELERKYKIFDFLESYEGSKAYDIAKEIYENNDDHWDKKELGLKNFFAILEENDEDSEEE